MRTGTSPIPLPLHPVFNGGKGLVWGARKISYSTRGTSGVIVYQIKGRNLCLAVMWNIPFVYTGYRNWWNIKVYEGSRAANEGNISSSDLLIQIFIIAILISLYAIGTRIISRDAQ